MVDVDKRTGGSGESEPIAPAIAAGDNGNFRMGIAGARDYKALLAQGTLREHPGAPVPYYGAATAPTIYGTNTEDTDVPSPVPQLVAQPVPQGIHRDPMATWVNRGDVPAGTTGYAGFNVRPQGRQEPGRSNRSFFSPDVTNY